MKTLFYDGLHFQTEAVITKRLRMSTYTLRIDLHRAHGLHRSRYTLNRWFIKEHTGNPFDNGFDSTAGSVRNDRASGSHRLDGRNSEVFFAREQEANTVTEKSLNLAIRDAAKKLYRRACDSL
jgi:hypothetical protein